MTNAKTQRGGPNRGQGRKRIDADDTTVRVNLTMTATQRDKLIKLGGSAWVRDMIECSGKS